MVGKVLKGREVLHHLRSKRGFLHWWIRSVKENPGWGILYWWIHSVEEKPGSLAETTSPWSRFVHFPWVCTSVVPERTSQNQVFAVYWPLNPLISITEESQRAL